MTANLTLEINSGTSGLSNARIEFAMAVSMVELNAEKADIRTYVRLFWRISTGTKPSANLAAAKTRTINKIKPRVF